MADLSLISNESMKQVINPFDGVRTSIVDGKTYWCLSDFCKLLGYSNAKNTVRDKVVYNETGVLVLDTPDTNNHFQNTKFGTIDVLNEIVMKSKLNNDMVNQWKQFSYRVSQEAVKSQLGMENDIDKMVNERVEKALSVHNSTNSLIQVLIEQNKHSDMLLAKMEEDSKRRDEDNKRFYAELFGKTNKLEDKVESVGKYKYSITEISSHIPHSTPGELNKYLVYYGYLTKSPNEPYKPTDKLTDLNLYKDSNDKYHTPWYKIEMVDLCNNLIARFKAE